MNGLVSERHGGKNWKKAAAEGQPEPGNCGDNASDLVEEHPVHSRRGRDATGVAENRKGQPTQRCNCCRQGARRQQAERVHGRAKCGYATMRGRDGVQVRLCCASAGECRSGACQGAQVPETSPDLQRKSGGEPLMSSDDKPCRSFQSSLLP